MHSIFAWVVGIATVAGVQASSPVFWTIANREAFLDGSFENLSIDQHGRLMLGPSLDVVYESTAPFLWTGVVAPDGAVYVGSGNEGQVLRIDPDGGDPTVVLDTAELEVHALAIAPDGVVYAGTSPDGRVYRIDPAGTSAPFFDPDDTYIWALAVDDAGRLHVGTGEAGLVYRVDAEGTGTVVYETKAAHVMSLAFEPSGTLLVGTESPGQLIRVDDAGRGFVLLNSEFDEIHTIRLEPDATIYATAVSGGPVSTARPPAAPPVATRSPSANPTPTVTTTVTAVTVGSAPSTANTPANQTAGGGRGGVYRIAPDGVWDLVWQSTDSLPYDIAVGDPDGLLVGTGGRGQILQLVGSPPSPTLLADAGARQVTGFVTRADGQRLYTTANPGKLVRLSATPATTGVYESDVRDARTVADWGVIRWQATTPDGTSVRLFTRSGNTATPDDAWSPWAGPYATAGGQPITSPKAQYLQWKAELTGSDRSPILTSATVAYLPRNTRPTVTSVTVHPPGIVFQSPFPTGDPPIAGLPAGSPERRLIQAAEGANGTSAGDTPTLGRRQYQKGYRTVVWRAQDDDNDELRYAVSYRREGDTTWRPLDDDLGETIVVWDTTSVPDGRYLVKVAALDAPSNAPDRAQVGELESAPFDIDNGPPVITTTGVQTGAATLVTLRVSDTHSPLDRVEYSLDAERWQVVYPTDGITDALVEDFTLTLDRDVSVERVVIRATDASNNVATGRVAP